MSSTRNTSPEPEDSPPIRSVAPLTPRDKIVRLFDILLLPTMLDALRRGLKQLRGHIIVKYSQDRRQKIYSSWSREDQEATKVEKKQLYRQGESQKAAYAVQMQNEEFRDAVETGLKKISRAFFEDPGRVEVHYEPVELTNNLRDNLENYTAFVNETIRELDIARETLSLYFPLLEIMAPKRLCVVMALLKARSLSSDTEIIICKACMRDIQNHADSISIFPPESSETTVRFVGPEEFDD